MIDSIRHYMLPGTATLAPHGTGQIVYTLPPDLYLNRLATPRRIVVRETPSTDQVLAAVRVAGKAVPASLVEMFDDRARRGPDFEPPRLPACKAGDTVIVYLANPTDTALKVDAVLQLADEPTHHVRLEEVLPVLAPGQSHTAVFRPSSAARILRVEFETVDEWCPPGWNLEQVQVGARLQMMATIPGAAAAAMFNLRGLGAPLLETARLGQEVRVRFGRCMGEQPSALTVRVVLEPMRLYERAATRKIRPLPAPPYGDDGEE